MIEVTYVRPQGPGDITETKIFQTLDAVRAAWPSLKSWYDYFPEGFKVTNVMREPIPVNWIKPR